MPVLDAGELRHQDEGAQTSTSWREERGQQVRGYNRTPRKYAFIPHCMVMSIERFWQIHHHRPTPLALSLPRVINFKFLLQFNQKYYITQCEELGFSLLTQMKDYYTVKFSPHHLRLGKITFWAWEWKGKRNHRHYWSINSTVWPMTPDESWIRKRVVRLERTVVNNATIGQQQQQPSINQHITYVPTPLTLSLPRVINFELPQQPHQKYDTTSHGELGFS